MEKYFKIEEREVLRYLGYGKHDADEYTLNVIDECRNELREIAELRYIYRVFDIEKSERRIEISRTKLSLEGNSIVTHLLESDKCALMAVTLGTFLDRRLIKYSKVDTHRGLILDACATVMVEEICDFVEKEIEEIALNEGFCITRRFSPGYGDLSIEIQSEFLNAIQSQRSIGITVNSSSILIPRKSVTAIIGFTRKSYQKKRATCFECDKFKNCNYKRSGDGCDS
ncbi:MAG: methionine synthase [Tissierellales bacterium]|jgi:tRNA threonylcarbamoyladenosine modification (KEOPS) complex  Pcc1 subunit|nr:methionine synthase [Tissierellales bacterium]